MKTIAQTLTVRFDDSRGVVARAVVTGPSAGAIIDALAQIALKAVGSGTADAPGARIVMGEEEVEVDEAGRPR